MKYVYAALACLCLAMPAFSQVTVHGQGTVTAAPDKATVVFSVTTEDVSATVALENNTVAMKKFLKTLSDLGVAKKDTQTSGFSVSPKYTYRQNDEPKLVGFTVTNQVTVTVTQFDTVPRNLGKSGFA